MGAVTPASPCRSLCQMDAVSGYCSGCWRTLDEIVCWGSADNDYKWAVLREVERRRSKEQPADGLL